MPDKIIIEQKCTCSCHNPGTAIMHFAPCCDNGIVRAVITDPEIVKEIIDFIKRSGVSF